MSKWTAKAATAAYVLAMGGLLGSAFIVIQMSEEDKDSAFAVP